MTIYDGYGNTIEIGGGGSAVAIEGDALRLDTDQKKIPAFNPQDPPEMSNIVQETAYTDPGAETWMETGLRFKNAQHLTAFEFTYTLEITGTATEFSAYMIGEDGTGVSGDTHAYAGSPVTVTDEFSSSAHLGSDYVSLVFAFATSNNTSATARIATGRKLTIPALPEGLIFDSVYVKRTPALTKNSLTFDNAAQYKQYNCRFSNKKYFAMGDSITQGVAPYYVSILGESLRCAKVTNGGVGGTSMVNLAGNILSKLWQGYDFVTIAHGVNDYDNSPNSPIGALAEHGSTFDKTTYIGAAQYIIETIQASSPNTEVILIAPIYNAEENTPNTLGLKLSDYRAALKSVADDYGLVFINGYDIINDSNKDGIFSDGTHLNAAGQAIYGVGLAERLSNE